MKKEKRKKDKPKYPLTDKKTAISNVPKYVKPRECFITGKGNKWRPINGGGCAHYVAHEKDFNIKYKKAYTINGKSAKKDCCYEGFCCDKKYVINISQIKKWINEQIEGNNWEKRQYGVQIREKDIWINTKTPAGTHTGFVNSIEPGKTIKIKISHCSSSSEKDISKSYSPNKRIMDGRFYGSVVRTNWLGNIRKKELHNLSNKKKNCQINEIIQQVYFPSKIFALRCGYDGCFYCLLRHHTR